MASSRAAAAPEHPHAFHRRRRQVLADTALAVFLLILQPVLFYRRVLINPRRHIPFDIEGFHLPLISYIEQAVRHGIAPLWNPYIYGGVPIHADIQAQLFYPFTWLAILAGNHSQGRNLFYWVEMLVPLHMVLAGLFAFWLLRRMGLRLPAAFIGASIYQLGGYFASQAQHLGAICAGAWLPLAALAVYELRHRIRARWVAVLALAVALTILSGFVATAVVVGFAVWLMVAALLTAREASWRTVPAVAASFVIGTLISTVALVPLWDLTQVSIASLRGNWYTNGGGLALQSLVSLVSPNHYHIFDLARYKQTYNFTQLYIYCGIVTPVLLVAALFAGKRRARVFLGVTVLCAFWMLGEHTPVYRSVYTHLPGLMRGALYSEYALMAFCFFAAITVALVLNHFGKRLPEFAWWAIAILISADLIFTGADRPMNSFAGSYKQSSSEYHIGGSRDLLPQLQKLVDRSYPPARMDYMDDGLWPAILGAGMFRLPTFDGDNPLALRRVLNVRRIFCAGSWWERKITVSKPDSPVLDMVNDAWLVSTTPLNAEEVHKWGLEYAGFFERVHVYHNPRALPRFFTVPAIRRSPGETASLQMLARAGFNPAAEAVVEGIAADRGGLAVAPVRVGSYTPNRIQLAVVTSGPAFLATSEPMYEGWQAWVNGRPAQLLMTNGAFRGLELPAGSNEIVMEYHPVHLRLYMWLSGLLALATIAVAVRRPAP